MNKYANNFIIHLKLKDEARKPEEWDTGHTSMPRKAENQKRKIHNEISK